MIKRKARKNLGYTVMELMITLVIIGVLLSTISPYFDILLRKTYQAKAKGNLAALRSALTIYYSEQLQWPFSEYPQGTTHYTADGLSFTSLLVPTYLSVLEPPRVFDRMSTFNGLTLSFDEAAKSLMTMTPTFDVYLLWGEPAYTPLLNSPFAFDNQRGVVYIPNGNYDTTDNYIYTW